MASSTPPNSPPDLFDLRGRRALITGASRGIGQAIAVAYAQRGAHVVGVARSDSGLKETAELAKGASGSFTPVIVDLRAPESIENCIADAVQVLGGLDILVNNAAADHDSPIEETSLETWRLVLDMNLQACWVAMKAASPYLQDGGGKVVNIASTLGLVAMRDDSAYIAAKHGLIGVTKALGLEWARKGVQVNAICPGFVETAMLPDLDANEGVAKYIRRTVPMGRWAQPEEIAGAAVFLASDATSYMTGQTVVVDGGLIVV